MTPYGRTQLKFDFREVIKTFGWTIKQETVYHERDWDCSWEEEFVVNQYGVVILNLSNISEKFAYELRDIAERIKNCESNYKST